MIRRTAARLALCCALALTMSLGGCAKILDIDTSDPDRRIGAAPVPYRVYDAVYGAEAWSQTFVRRLAEEEIDLLILGEIHDNPDHHRLQAWLTATLNGLRKRGGIAPTMFFGGVQGLAFEMIPSDREAEVNALRSWRPGLPRPGESAAAAAEIGRILDWPSSGWPAWSNYSQIVTAAPQAYIAGGGVPRGALREQAKEGAGTSPLAARYALDQPLPPAQQKRREEGQVAAHCGAIPASAAAPMVAAQRIRDASFAEALLRAEDEGNGFSILITGNGHARKDWGVPAALQAAAPEKTVISVAMIEIEPGQPLDRASLAAEFGADRPPFDYVIATWPPVDRGDPCAAFK